MRKLGVLLVLMLVALVGGWLVLQGPESPRRSSVEKPANAAVEVPSAEERVEASHPSSASAPKSLVPADERGAEREELRKRILDALHARERAREQDAAESATQREEASTTDDALAPTPTPTLGGLTDRTGTHEYLVKVVNEDLMPLADECYALTLVEQPDLAGLLVLDFEIIGDEEIGGIVESVVPGHGNELADPDLLECMRESILSTTLPAPEHGGRDAISLSIPLAPDEVDL